MDFSLPYPSTASPAAGPLAWLAVVLVQLRTQRGQGAVRTVLGPLTSPVKAALFAAVWVGLRRILPRSKPGMQITNVEGMMARNELYPPRCGHRQANNVINCYLWFDRCPTVPEITSMFSTIVRAHRRWRSVPIAGGWREVDVPLEDHVRVREAASEQEAVATLDRELPEGEWPMDRPLWSVEVMRVPPPGRSVVVVRVHHTMGDGVGLFQNLAEVATDLHGELLQLPGGSLPKKKGGLVAGVLWYADAARSILRILLSSKVPFETDLPMLCPDRRTLTKPRPRKTLFFPTLDLAYVKRVKDAAGCTVNDAIFTVWAGAVRRYCEARGSDFSKPVTLRALLSVALPRLFEADHDPQDKLLNSFYFVSVPFDASSPDVLARLKGNKSNLDVVKKTTLALAAKFLANHVGNYLPLAVQQETMADLVGRHSVVFSNLPGPKTEFKLFGQQVRAIQGVFYNIVPQFIGLSVGNRIFMNFTADPNVVDGLGEEFVNCFTAELEEMGRAVGVEGSCLWTE
mmetsp:Transcript_43097/g.103954  ORF Transcript_43097/g.103954 Transcript_43097/m.103954 type:complete len:514 (-) Transcript_43097:148-1689(-)